MRPDKGFPLSLIPAAAQYLLSVRSVLKWHCREVNFEVPAGWKST